MVQIIIFADAVVIISTNLKTEEETLQEMDKSSTRNRIDNQSIKHEVH